MLPFLPRILEAPDEFFLFRVEGDGGIARSPAVPESPDEILELGVPVGIRASFPGLPNRLKPVVHICSRPLPDVMTFEVQFFSQLDGAFCLSSRAAISDRPERHGSMMVLGFRRKAPLFDQHLALSSVGPDAISSLVKTPERARYFSAITVARSSINSQHRAFHKVSKLFSLDFLGFQKRGITSVFWQQIDFYIPSIPSRTNLGSILAYQ